MANNIWTKLGIPGYCGASQVCPRRFDEILSNQFKFNVQKCPLLCTAWHCCSAQWFLETKIHQKQFTLLTNFQQSAAVSKSAYFSTIPLSDFGFCVLYNLSLFCKSRNSLVKLDFIHVKYFLVSVAVLSWFTSFPFLVTASSDSKYAKLLQA